VDRRVVAPALIQGAQIRALKGKKVKLPETMDPVTLVFSLPNCDSCSRFPSPKLAALLQRHNAPVVLLVVQTQGDLAHWAAAGVKGRNVHYVARPGVHDILVRDLEPGLCIRLNSSHQIIALAALHSEEVLHWLGQN